MTATQKHDIIPVCTTVLSADQQPKEDSVKEMSRAGPKKGAQNQPCQPRSFQGMSEKEEKFKQNQVQ